MTDSFRTTPPQQQWSAPNPGGNGFQSAGPDPSRDADDGAGEMGRALVVGLLGGLLSVAGYLVYRRLPEEQKERLHSQVRSTVQQRINELRQNFNI
ncbi:MAG TPA: hypothetical protein VGF86_08455 [Candidatus Tumulicola sp.]|jgi:hypothetical protein